MDTKPQFEILLFYKYVEIADPKKFMYEQRALCERFHLTGRMIIAEEGINATLEGTKNNTDAYCKALFSDPRFSDVHMKRSTGTGDAFPRLSIKVRKDIVSNALTAQVDPRTTTGKRLSPDELHKWMKEKRDSFYIVDMRNDYEHKSGHFDGSILPPLKNFRDLSDVTKNDLSHLKDKTVVTVCTGGVRCEKASGYLVKEGFNDVYQLDGGIVSYMEKYPSDGFKGSLYVFDKRKVMHFDDPATHEVVGRCDLCGLPSENYENCSLDTCHHHFICCLDCKKAQNDDHFCSVECMEGKSLLKKDKIFASQQ